MEFKLHLPGSGIDGVEATLHDHCLSLEVARCLVSNGVRRAPLRRAIPIPAESEWELVEQFACNDRIVALHH